MTNPKISFILTNEVKRQMETVELIASENFASQAVMNLCGSVFTNKYAEGYPVRDITMDASKWMRLKILQLNL